VLLAVAIRQATMGRISPRLLPNQGTGHTPEWTEPALICQGPRQPSTNIRLDTAIERPTIGEVRFEPI